MTGASTSERLAELSGSLTPVTAGPAALQAARLHLLDGIGVTIGGSRSPLAEAVRAYRARLGLGDTGAAVLAPQSPGPGRPDDDAFCLASYAFSENYGDTSLRSVAHPNTVVVPALLAAARARPVAGSRMLTAVIAGYQAMEYLARSLNNGSPRMGHQIRGFRPSASCGAVGAALAVAHAWDLPRSIAKTAVELACNYGGGLRRAGSGALSALWVQSGESARAGVTAVLLALAGLQGEDHLVEGVGGFLPAYMAEALDPTASVYLDAERWAVMDVAFKLHSTPHTLHTALDCILDLQAEDGLRPSDVEGIRIAIPAQHATISASDGYRHPATAIEGGASYPYATAVVVVGGDYAWPEQLDRFLSDHEVRRIAEATTVVVDAEQSQVFDEEPGTWPAQVEVATAGGRLRRRRRVPRGLDVDAELEGALERKFRRLVSRAVAPADVEALVVALNGVAVAPDIHALLTAAMGG